MSMALGVLCTLCRGLCIWYALLSDDEVEALDSSLGSRLGYSLLSVVYTVAPKN